jgi:hypothetical protein
MTVSGDDETLHVQNFCFSFCFHVMPFSTNSYECSNYIRSLDE